MLNLDEVRKNIILKEGIYYFDYTASGLAYEPIEQEILKFLKTYANTHSDSSSSAILTQRRYENARSELKNLLGLNDEFCLIGCGSGASAAIKKFQEIVGIYIPPKTKERYHIRPLSNLPLVILGPYEHHSNEVSFREGMCDVVRIGLDESGGVDFKMLEHVLKMNKNREIIASFSAASNVTGVLSDYKKIYALIKSYSGILALDASSLSAYANVDSDYFDALFLAPHKLLGGVGSCGLLAIKKSLVDTSLPTFAAGGTVAYVSRTSHQFVKNIEQLEEGGTPGIVQMIRANLAYKLRNEIGFERIKSRESELNELFASELEKINEVVCYCPKNLPRVPIFAFNVRGISPYDFAATLSNDFGIQTRAGCACAGPYGHDLLGLKDNVVFDKKPGWVRVSLHYTHTKEDVIYLVQAIKKSIDKHKNSWGEELALHSIFAGKI
ncbi:aminotransferase class V-fold PLP-dependent enzyme [Campylobacter sp.]|uniref:aminotransferase class V-fold PLP-dependent enzyme n=1 Tax=Campylobacter sp. TaxID=205 RepID=UPI0027055246|nr:aminotransferase class V-fold PLP-dependent enzyme [Campylobacter sp.]